MLAPLKESDPTSAEDHLCSDESGLEHRRTRHGNRPAFGEPLGRFVSGPGSPFWVSNQGSNSTTLYSVTGSIDISPPPPVPVFTVNIPATGTGPQGPTGQVSNTNPDAFHLTAGNQLSANFIFADLNGTISAWNGSLGTNGSTAHIEVTTPGAVYTGLAVNEAQRCSTPPTPAPGPSTSSTVASIRST